MPIRAGTRFEGHRPPEPFRGQYRLIGGRDRAERLDVDAVTVEQIGHPVVVDRTGNAGEQRTGRLGPPGDLRHRAGRLRAPLSV